MPYCRRAVMTSPKMRLAISIAGQGFRWRSKEVPLLRRADRDPDAEHDDAAEHDLEHRLQERRIHVARADIGDRPQFEEYDDAGDRGRDPECVGKRVRDQ